MHFVIPLKDRDVELLREVFPDGSIRVAHQLHLESETIDSVLDAISDRLLSHGIDDEYEATRHGEELEKLLDKINRVRLAHSEPNPEDERLRP